MSIGRLDALQADTSPPGVRMRAECRSVQREYNVNTADLLQGLQTELPDLTRR